MKKGYSKLIRPLSILLDLLVVNGALFTTNKLLFLNDSFLIYINIGWLVTSVLAKFYKVYRFTNLAKIVSLLIKQLTLFLLVFFAYFGLFDEAIPENNFLTLCLIAGGISLLKFLSLLVLRMYRAHGKNYSSVIIIGSSDSLVPISKIFHEYTYLGYRLLGYFSDKKSNKKDYLGSVSEVKPFVLKNKIDEIYCSISDLTEEELKSLIRFADQYQIGIKLIPDSKGLYSKKMKLEYYDYLPVLSLNPAPLKIPVNKLIKRVCDVLISFLVIVFVLSWLVPLMGLIIKLESKGPVFFKQKRTGLNDVSFGCYKFRSMCVNDDSDKQSATRGDMRITKVGKFIRKTSIDELPQFFNVFFGEMSVVGPRPHMLSHSQKFAERIDNFMLRSNVKPGITGLAQVKGCRGEIETVRDIINRVKFDIFYIENWSLLLDFKILFLTVYNVFKGEEKAY